MQANKIFIRILLILLALFLVVSCCFIPANAETLPNLTYNNSLLTESLLISSEKTAVSQSKYFYYSALTDKEKTVYNELVKAINKCESLVDLRDYNVDTDSVYNAFNAISDEHPEYFYLAHLFIYTNEDAGKAEKAALLYKNGGIYDEISENGTVIIKADRGIISKKIKEINNKTKAILNKIPADASLVVKEKFIHDYLCNTITYDKNAANLIGNADLSLYNDWNIYGALVEGSAVCEGYAKTFSYLCRLVGINAITVRGYAKESGEGHMWNAVQLSNEWYLVDVTWDDGDNEIFPVMNTYFNITEKTISKTHVALDYWALPECNATKYSYKSLCINMENDKLSSNYKEVIDRVVAFRENMLPIYIGTDNDISDSVLDSLIKNENSPVMRYIKEKNYKVKFSNGTYGWPQYKGIGLIYPCKDGAHKYSNSCDEICNICEFSRKTSHKYSSDCDRTCNVCKAKRTIKHTYKNVITKATLTKNGKISYKCSKCGYIASKTTTIKKIKSVKLSTTSYTYTGKIKTPGVVIKDSAGKTLKKNTDYTVKYASGKKNVGTYKVTITFKGKYSGTKVLTFKINPPKTSVSKLVAGKKALTVKVSKKTAQVSGYQIQYSTSKSFKSYKTATLTSSKKTSTTIKKLSAKKTYYVRVRTYKTVSGKKYYSAWSTIKYKKTK